MAPLPQNPESLVVVVADKLRGILVENGYKSNVQQVYRVPISLDQIPTVLPVLTVVVTSQANTFKERQLYRAQLDLVIGGMVGSPTSDLLAPDRATALNLLLADTINALNDDPRFGLGVHVDSVIGPAAEIVIEADRPVAYFALGMHLTYHFARGTL